MTAAFMFSRALYPFFNQYFTWDELEQDVGSTDVNSDDAISCRKELHFGKYLFIHLFLKRTINKNIVIASK